MVFVVIELVILGVAALGVVAVLFEMIVAEAVVLLVSAKSNWF